jgi:MFS family permease
MYIAEVSPARIRGRMVSLNQLAIVFGMLAVYFVNYGIAHAGDLDAWNVQTGWRWMFGSETFPAVALLVLLFFVPESPRWLDQGGSTRTRPGSCCPRGRCGLRHDWKWRPIEASLAREKAVSRVATARARVLSKGVHAMRHVPSNPSVNVPRQTDRVLAS